MWAFWFEQSADFEKNMAITDFNAKVWAQLLLSLMLIAMVTSCRNNPTDLNPATPFFPQQREPGPNTVLMEALLPGKLVLVKECLRVQDRVDNRNVDYLLIWPHGFSLRVEGEIIQIKNSTGQLVARVGDQVAVGGGETRLDQIEYYMAASTLPNDCPGPYWIVSSISRQ